MTDLLTGRLILHPLTAAEAEAIIEAGHGGPEYPSPADVEAAVDFVKHCRESGDPQPFGAYEVRLRGTGEPIGGAGFNHPLDEHGTTTVGFGLIPAARGQGYAAEALRAMLELARRLGARRIDGSANLENVASQRVMEAAGMIFTHADDRERFYSYRIEPEPGRPELGDPEQDDPVG
ncbi:GNAT family N-acetyltransferase [Microlunatus parietis]|uniref:RimJ/RimL family protein N-acetyltransferase n=1 Tax=Microlunatus parietis TaxID=682979 RepID=A0A7Y9I9Q1_9ACTN|nr:GNAT family N-acetyltransferase [Microlunatus parietis]NYE72918.1 RimJ/RimL family protein N-acetyltransferase [Microlunatus parietis]